MIRYDIKRFFRTRWVWFADPCDVLDVDEVAFLSYKDGAYPGFRKKVGLTSVIDLSPTEDQLWQNMRGKFIRKQIQRGYSRGIRVREGSLREFLPVYESFVTQKKISGNAVQDAASVGSILVAYRNEQVLAGGLFLSDGVHVRAFALASVRLDPTAKESSELIGYANRILLWEAIRKFKGEGHALFDMGGIDPAGPHSEQALSEFKEAFGGARSPQFFYIKTYSKLLETYRKLKALLLV